MSDQRRPPVLITDIINQASQLREAGIETPEHDAKLLLAEAAGVELRDVDRALLMGRNLAQPDSLPSSVPCSTAVPSASRCNTSPGMLLSATLT